MNGLFTFREGSLGNKISVDASGRLVASTYNGQSLYIHAIGETGFPLVVDASGRMILSPDSVGLGSGLATGLYHAKNESIIPGDINLDIGSSSNRYRNIFAASGNFSNGIQVGPGSLHFAPNGSISSPTLTFKTSPSNSWILNSDNQLSTTQNNATAALAIAHIGSTTAVVITNLGDNACLQINASGNSAGIQVNQLDGEDAITTNGDMRCQQIIASLHAAIANNGAIQFSEVATPLEYYDVLSLSQSNKLIIGNSTREYPIQLQLGNTYLTGIAAGAERFRISSSGILSTVVTANSGSLSTGQKIGTTHLLSDGTFSAPSYSFKIGSTNKWQMTTAGTLSLTQAANSRSIAIVQDGDEEAMLITQNTNNNGLSITAAGSTSRAALFNKSGTGGNPSVEIKNAGTGKHIDTDAGAGTPAHLTNTGTWTNASCWKHLKTNFEEIDEKEYLEQIAQMPVMKFNIKKDIDNGIEKTKTLSVFQDDLVQRFGLREDGINPQEIASLGIVGVKALYSIINDLSIKLKKLEEKIEITK